MGLLIDDETEQFRVVYNSKDQYSIWPATLSLPAGWTECAAGSREYCLNKVNCLWKDLNQANKLAH